MILPGARPQDVRSLNTEEDPRQKPSSFREDSQPAQSPLTDGVSKSAVEGRNPLGAIGNEGPSSKGKEVKDDYGAPVTDPLAGMAPIDRWGLKGLRTLMNNYPDYNALLYGMDPSSLGLDLSSTE